MRRILALAMVLGAPIGGGVALASSGGGASARAVKPHRAPAAHAQLSQMSPPCHRHHMTPAAGL
jgi:hypothetical protein